MAAFYMQSVGGDIRNATRARDGAAMSCDFREKKKGSKNSHPFPATTRGLMAHGFSLRLCIVRRLPIELSPSRRILQNKYKQISMAINSTEEKNINVITYGSISCTNIDRSIRIISRTYPENDRQKFNSIPRIIY